MNISLVTLAILAIAALGFGCYVNKDATGDNFGAAFLALAARSVSAILAVAWIIVLIAKMRHH